MAAVVAAPFGFGLSHATHFAADSSLPTQHTSHVHFLDATADFAQKSPNPLVAGLFSLTGELGSF